MRRDEKLALAGAVLVGLFGLVMIAGVLIGSLEKTSEYSPTTDALLSVLFGVLPLAAGIFLVRRTLGAVARRRREEREAAVLGVAKDHQGVVTAVDVAAECGMSLEQAEQTLGALHRRGFSEMDVTDAGTVVYRFRL
jgi:hypothetical protein